MALVFVVEPPLTPNSERKPRDHPEVVLRGLSRGRIILLMGPRL